MKVHLHLSRVPTISRMTQRHYCVVDPFVRVKLNGTCLASDVVVTLDCADAYSQEFESSLVGVASQAMTAVRQGRLCVGGAVAAVSSGSTSLVAVANTVAYTQTPKYIRTHITFTKMFNCRCTSYKFRR